MPNNNNNREKEKHTQKIKNKSKKAHTNRNYFFFSSHHNSFVVVVVGSCVDGAFDDHWGFVVGFADIEKRSSCSVEQNDVGEDFGHKQEQQLVVDSCDDERYYYC
jgi:hypothetical protein